MPKNRPSRAIRCPYCKGRIFESRFVEHLINSHSFSEENAGKLRGSARWEPFNKGTPHRAATVDLSVISKTVISPEKPEPEPEPEPEPTGKPLTHMDRNELMALVREMRGEG